MSRSARLLTHFKSREDPRRLEQQSTLMAASSHLCQPIKKRSATQRKACQYVKQAARLDSR